MESKKLQAMYVFREIGLHTQHSFHLTLPVKKTVSRDAQEFDRANPSALRLRKRRDVTRASAGKNFMQAQLYKLTHRKQVSYKLTTLIYYLIKSNTLKCFTL